MLNYSVAELRFFMKYVAPIAIGIVFLNELGILKWITGK